MYVLILELCLAFWALASCVFVRIFVLRFLTLVTKSFISLTETVMNAQLIDDGINFMTLTCIRLSLHIGDKVYQTI